MPRPNTKPISLGYWFVHPGIGVERWNGDEVYGPDYDDSETLTGFIDQGEQLIAGVGDEEITSIAKVYLPIDTAWVPLQSRVTLPAEFGGRVCEVVAANRRVMRTLPLPEFLELALK